MIRRRTYAVSSLDDFGANASHKRKKIWHLQYQNLSEEEYQEATLPLRIILEKFDYSTLSQRVVVSSTIHNSTFVWHNYENKYTSKEEKICYLSINYPKFSHFVYHIRTSD